MEAVPFEISDILYYKYISATFPVFPGVSKLLIKSSGIGHRISREIPTMGFFKKNFVNFVIFVMSKRKITQEVDLVHLFELLSTGKRKTEG